MSGWNFLDSLGYAALLLSAILKISTDTRYFGTKCDPYASGYGWSPAQPNATANNITTTDFSRDGTVECRPYARVLTIGIIVSYFKILKYVRALQTFGPLVTMFYPIAIDTLKWVVLYCVMLVAFAMAFLAVSTHDSSINTIWDALFTTYRITIGDFGYEDFDGGTHDQSMLTALYVGYGAYVPRLLYFIIIICPPIYLFFLPHFRLYEAVLLHRCVLLYKYPYAQGCDLS